MQCVGCFDFFFARQSGIRTDALLFFRVVSGVRMKPSGGPVGCRFSSAWRRGSANETFPCARSALPARCAQ
ncbi:hypothetical protein ALP92_102639 [Pseudomonas syringae pv. primulae]|uniref:Uncharacterized protein n=1 Tax=Pseudomonas syringae pv. primulae TaxID=251707 RepID=A0A3M4S5C7_9PSED|nr:hypothetical protein ALP92_102639 [Pseudomonas syringae pv. primulae]